MRALIEVLRRVASLFHRRELEDRLSEEIQFHVDQQIAENLRTGLSPDDARRQALIRFGGVERVREQTRDEFRAAPLEHLARDVRYGLRSLRRNPGFTAMAVLSLAIGIGANTAIFGVAYAVLFRQSPLAHPEALVNVYGGDGAQQFNPMSYPDIEDLRRGTTQVFSGVAASAFTVAQIDRGGTPTTVMGEAVTGGAFALLGIEPQLGRAIQPADDVGRGGHPVVMLRPRLLATRLRRRSAGGRTHAADGTPRLHDHRRRPVDYRGGLPAVTSAFFVPLAMQDELMGIEMLRPPGLQQLLRQGAPRSRRDPSPGRARGLARGGVSRPRAAARVDSGGAIRARAGVRSAGRSRRGSAAARGGLALDRRVGLVLLLACTNLASFLVARAIDRGQEIAVRRALGAGRGALARQVLVESVLLGLGGAAAGLALAVALLDVLLSIDLPLPYGIRLDLQFGLGWRTLFDWRVLAFTAGAGVMAGVFLGLVPAGSWHARRSGRGAQGGQQGQRGARTSPLAQRHGRRPDRHVDRAASWAPACSCGAGSRCWPWTPGFGRAPTAILSVIMPVTQSAPEAAVVRTRRLLERFRALPGEPARRPRLAVAARALVERNQFHHRWPHAACRPGGLQRLAGNGGWRILRCRWHEDRRGAHLQ
jgi:hypothetical protein